MARKKTPKLSIENFGQIDKVDIAFGDLTVLVGAQGSGKSLALQWLKLAVDGAEVSLALRESGFDLRTAANVLDAYFGEGMSGALKPSTKVVFDGSVVRPESLLKKGTGGRGQAKMFYVPAHRALLLAEGWPAPFMKLSADTPVVARLFSQALYEQLSRPHAKTIFPQNRVLMKDIRDRIDSSIFHGGTVDLQHEGLRRRLELRYGKSGLPFMMWTAGQREFAPLLLGLYSVLPARKLKKVDGLDWVVIEEPEMGLHPRAIATVMILVIDLLWRGYRVVLSTHSPLVLDVVWAMREFKHPKAKIKDLANALELTSQGAIDKLRSAVSGELRVYYLAHDERNRVASQDISALRPDAESEGESNWGGLTKFGTSLSDAVARIPEDEDES